jgi:DNA-directed RNA polymerase specialized sigma24 family protein
MKEDLHQEILNAQQREALRLWEEERLTYPQIASRMGLSEGRIQQVLSVARARVRDCSEHGEGALCLVPSRVRHFLEN